MIGLVWLDLACVGPGFGLVFGSLELGIRTCGSWRRAAEERERPRWLEAWGDVRSAAWGTAEVGKYS